MAKTRISISLEPEDAEAIKAVAAEHGLDVSAFLVMAGRKEAARLARIAAAFADIDAALAEAEAEGDALAWPPATGPDVDADEAARVRSEIAAARARSAERRRGSAA
ncbi:hypothetical protein [Streptomyces sp. PR69]|uniref:hypothetical protein n=1 Tax=Streptomyces sp. PR69 TaxID=2984950 RepID=UPI002264A3C3|nr:hypothetical protein [Streptomyces sp. PR69]